ncbi:DUF3140 domain-containing protein [Spirosoma sp. BT702]|uniref:DUF3140 domain-containing protein n=1 Tax=Spirosoma profusum TaxID=2771354 RepID=A0A927AU13_9BACT|nr:DUF3140 domain-containing protein [Spirosoma profusum]MBD2701907.1 DUF3140 domain-containing protein [Spirosoma profusum]
METAVIDEKEKKAIRAEFTKVVNMSVAQLEKWLKSEESKSVGQRKDGDSESIGHKSGKHIISFLKKNVHELTDDDYDHMEKVISYIKRHSAQRPDHVAGSNWAYSLKNWGHDPEK